MTYNRRDLAVKVGINVVKGYTMKEISALEDRIKSLEYYTVLNMLALDSKTLSLKNDDGFERFKQGIFADPFNDDTIAKTNDTEFNMAISSGLSIARPNFNEAFIRFDIDSTTSTGITVKGPFAMLNYGHENIGGNQFATKYRNCAESFYSFQGAVQLYPEFDNSNQDTRKATQTIEIDLAKGFEDAAKANAFKDVDTIQGNPTSKKTGRTTTYTSNTTQTITDIKVTSTTKTQDLGDVVRDVSTLPYMVSRPIAFIATGLKPNTIVYPFFDKISVASQCAPGDVNSAPSADPSTIVIKKGANGDTLKTNNVGAVAGLFTLPADTFRSGERVFTLIDTQDITAVDAILTSAEGRYTASGLSVTKQDVKFQVEEPVFTPSTTTQTLPPLVWSYTDPPPPPPSNPGNQGTGGCCFDPAALVTMSDGTLKKICEIEIGDLVANGTDGINTVIGIEAPVLGNRLMYSFNDNWAFVSEEHPIMTSEGWGAFDPDSWAVEGEFIGKLVKIDIGSEILKSDGTYETVEHIDHKIISEDYIIYNLLLDGDHIYNVEGYVVHNKTADNSTNPTIGVSVYKNVSGYDYSGS
jgi:hypothetical protein